MGRRDGTGPVAVASDVADRGGQPLTRHPVVLGLAIALVAANLRPALASVGPVLPDIRADLGLSGALTASLVAIPVLCLGVFAGAAPRLARRWGMEPVLAVVLAAIIAGLALRVVDGAGLLFACTVLISAAIAVGNVLLPALIKRDFPAHSGTMMGVYTMALSGSAALAAALTVPVGELISRGWRGALGVWALLALLALLVWLPFARAHTPPPASAALSGAARRSLLRDPLAWQVTVFFGLQSLAFYSVLSWLPSIYREHGYQPAAASFVLAVSTFVQIPVALLLPRLAAGARDQRLYAAGCTLFTAAGLVGVLIAPTAAPYLWAVLIGVGQGGCFAIGLSFFVLRSHTPADTARLSAMAQTCGYVIAAAGPLLLGALRDASGSWTLPLVFLLMLGVPQLTAGVLAGRALYVGESGSSRRAAAD